MSYTVTPEDIQKIRYELNDNSGPGLYILDDSTISYYLEKNQGSISRSSIDCCRAILLRLSMDSKDQICDILAIKSYKTAEQYRLALELYLKNPFTNPLIGSANGWVGGISVSEMQANINAPDNYVSPLAVPSQFSTIDNDSSNPFSI